MIPQLSPTSFYEIPHVKQKNRVVAKSKSQKQHPKQNQKLFIILKKNCIASFFNPDLVLHIFFYYVHVHHSNKTSRIRMFAECSD